MKSPIRRVSRHQIPLLILLLVATLSGCGKKESRKAVAEEREAWEASLADSVALTARMQDSVKSRLTELQERTESLLAHFRTVDNPREVEKYYLPQVSGYSYPLTQTGLVARLTASEQLELIAVNIGKPFDQIEVTSGGEGRRSAVVPHDQSLNYWNGNMTTVAFSGAQADSIAALIATPGNSNVTVIYLQNGTMQDKAPLDAPSRQGISLAWGLADTRQQTLLSERELTRLGRRLSIIEAERDRLGSRKE